jgi:membrane-bound inhibitor of C-type lysozyme
MKLSKYFVLLGFLAACGDDDGGTPPAAKRDALKCGAYDVAIEYVAGDADTLKTSINGEKITMYRAVSASGAKYEGKGSAISAALWNKGQSWTLHVGGDAIKCKSLKKQ